ncbi:Flp family type IVb pilin [Caulobacter sp. NIBR2454]|uniref:Flp family type IVb pilin n=1 Tax=Caulobacter sp. NIBR2454 TaxID=3015996 RepID=UPI0022B6B299|nr:Flp family type IVb pilin [Caulobacter sp. NIBR2454]
MKISSIKNLTSRFIKEDKGLAAIEYAVMGFLLIAAITAAVGPLQGSLVTAFTNVGTEIEAATAD